jgi:hypothetical protein
MVYLLLTVAVLAGVGIGIFVWRQISAEQKRAGACALCSAPISSTPALVCGNCQSVVCAACAGAALHCPRCNEAWPVSAAG